MFENALNIAPDKQQVHQRATPRPISNVVETQRSAIAFLERVGMVPQLVWPGQLHIHKLMRRLPGNDFSSPGDGKSMDANPVINQRSSFDDDGFGGEYFKIQPRGGDCFQVLHVGEKLKNLRSPTRQEEFCVKSKFFHRLLEFRLDAARPQRAPTTQGFK